MSEPKDAAIVELATVKLAAGKTEADLLAASNAFQTGFLSAQPGFMRRELVRKKNGEYVDVIHWRSQADADAVMAKAPSSPAVQAFFSVMDVDPSQPETGVEHCASIAVYDGA